MNGKKIVVGKPKIQAIPALKAPEPINRGKSIFSRIAEIVIEDIKVKLGIDRKSIAEREKHKEFLRLASAASREMDK